MSQGRTVVVKVGGEIVGDGDLLAALVTNIRRLVSMGWQVVICHGAGPQTTAIQKGLGIEPIIVGGRRVTSPRDLTILAQAIGETNARLVGGLQSAAIRTLGMTGASGPLVAATRRPPTAVTGSDGELIDFGEVGDIDTIDTNLLRQLMSLGLLPVIGTLGIDSSGTLLNINADTTASAIAAALGAEAFAAVTAVGGIRTDAEDQSTTLSTLDQGSADVMIAAKTLHSGMIPKVDTGFEALRAGVRVVAVVGVERDDSILAAIEGLGSGTRLTR